MTNSIDEGKYPMVVRAGTLAAFLAEVPPGATVRMMQTHRQQACFRTLVLHAPVVTAGGDVAWLCTRSHVLAGRQPTGRQDRQIAEGMQKLHKELITHFTALGYLVQDQTDFGLPGAVKPVNARIGRWAKNADGDLTVALATGPAVAP